MLTALLDKAGTAGRGGAGAADRDNICDIETASLHAAATVEKGALLCTFDYSSACPSVARELLWLVLVLISGFLGAGR